MAEAFREKPAEAGWAISCEAYPSRKTAGLVTLRESRMNAAEKPRALAFISDS
jgi:hypothetical protein